jgi:hypothetical protein
MNGVNRSVYNSCTFAKCIDRGVRGAVLRAEHGAQPCKSRFTGQTMISGKTSSGGMRFGGEVFGYDFDLNGTPDLFASPIIRQFGKL